jgi:hypothetical protein
MRNFCSLAVNNLVERGRRERGSRGFYRRARLGGWARVCVEIGDLRAPDAAVLREESQREEEETCQVEQSVRERRGQRCTFWDGELLGCGPNLAQAGSVSPRPSFLFFVHFFSFFCFSYFFHIICNNASKQFKPLSKVF